MKTVLLILIIDPALPFQLQRRAIELAGQTCRPEINPSLNISIFVDRRKIVRKMDDEHRPWSLVTRARNGALATCSPFDYDYILWVDADITGYPADMPSLLIGINPHGVTAPLVLVENTNIMYDWAACILKGKDGIEPFNRQFISGRNLAPENPYWPKEPIGVFVEMDCVGAVTMVPAHLYAHLDYFDHPAFTDHYNICRGCRDLGLKVGIAREVIAYHANLPDYGLSWH